MQTIPNLDEGELRKKFSHYFEFQSVLGHGSFGLVVAATDKKTRELVAVKVVKKELIGQTHTILRNEAKILSQFDHRNIVKYKRVIETDMRLLLVLECLKGGRLSQKMYDLHKNGGEITEEQASIIIKAIAEGVAYLHLKDTIHRDLKPENILLADSENISSVKIIDFGLAGQYDLEKEAGTSFSERWGTKIYMAPEMFDKKGYGKPIDVWSIGVIMYQLLNGGRHPYYDKSDDTLESYQRKIITPITPPSHLSELAKHLLSSLLELDPSKRYTATMILSHPWITRNFHDKLPLTMEQKLEVYQQKQTLIRVIKAIMFAQIVDKFNSVENSQLSPQRSGIFKSRDELESLESPPSLLHLQRDSQNEESSNLIDISNGIPNNRNPPAKFASGGSNSTMTTTDENSPIRRKNSIGSYTEITPILPRLNLGARDPSPPILRKKSFSNFESMKSLNMTGRLPAVNDQSIRKTRITNTTAMIWKLQASGVNQPYQADSGNSSGGSTRQDDETNKSRMEFSSERHSQWQTRQKSKSQINLQRAPQISNFSPERNTKKRKDTYFPRKIPQDEDHDQSSIGTPAESANQIQTRRRNNSLPIIAPRIATKASGSMQPDGCVQSLNPSRNQISDSPESKTNSMLGSTKYLSFSSILAKIVSSQSKKKAYPSNQLNSRAATMGNDEPEKKVIKIIAIKGKKDVTENFY